MDSITIGVIVALFFLYMYLFQRKYAENYVSYDSGSPESEEEEEDKVSEGYSNCGSRRQ
jgi:hypothetical protein